MKIIVKETRKSDALKCLEKYLNDDCISIINDYLDNKVVSVDNYIKYNDMEYKNSRKVYYKYFTYSYLQYNHREKECAKDILKILFHNNNKTFFRKELHTILKNKYGYKRICIVVNNMIQSGLCRFKYGNPIPTDDEIEYTNKYGKKKYKTKFVRIITPYITF